MENWVEYHDQIEPFGLPYNMYEIKLVYVGEDPDARNKELLNGNGEAVGKVRNGFKGQLLIGDELRTITFAYWFENYGNGLCRSMASWANEFDCTKLDDHFLEPRMSAERKGSNYMNAVPGQVISLYIYGPTGEAVSYNEFNVRFWAGQEALFDALVEKGDTSIGTFVPAWPRKVCDINNQRRVPNQCYSEADVIIIPGY